MTSPARLLQRHITAFFVLFSLAADVVPDGLDELNQGNEDDDRCLPWYLPGNADIRNG